MPWYESIIMDSSSMMLVLLAIAHSSKFSVSACRSSSPSEKSCFSLEYGHDYKYFLSTDSTKNVDLSDISYSSNTYRRDNQRVANLKSRHFCSRYAAASHIDTSRGLVYCCGGFNLDDSEFGLYDPDNTCLISDFRTPAVKYNVSTTRIDFGATMPDNTATDFLHGDLSTKDDTDIDDTYSNMYPDDYRHSDIRNILMNGSYIQLIGFAESVLLVNRKNEVVGLTINETYEVSVPTLLNSSSTGISEHRRLDCSAVNNNLVVCLKMTDHIDQTREMALKLEHWFRDSVDGTIKTWTVDTGYEIDKMEYEARTGFPTYVIIPQLQTCNMKLKLYAYSLDRRHARMANHVHDFQWFRNSTTIDLHYNELRNELTLEHCAAGTSRCIIGLQNMTTDQEIVGALEKDYYQESATPFNLPLCLPDFKKDEVAEGARLQKIGQCKLLSYNEAKFRLTKDELLWLLIGISAVLCVVIAAAIQRWYLNKSAIHPMTKDYCRRIYLDTQEPPKEGTAAVQPHPPTLIYRGVLKAKSPAHTEINNLAIKLCVPRRLQRDIVAPSRQTAPSSSDSNSADSADDGFLLGFGGGEITELVLPQQYASSSLSPTDSLLRAEESPSRFDMNLQNTLHEYYSTHDEHEQAYMKSFSKHIKLLKMLNRKPYIMPLLRFLNHKSVSIIVMPWYDKLLRDYIEDRDEDLKFRLTLQLLHAIDSLENINKNTQIIHNDLHINNVLVSTQHAENCPVYSRNSSNKLHIAITDFELAKIIKNTDSTFQTSRLQQRKSLCEIIRIFWKMSEDWRFDIKSESFNSATSPNVSKVLQILKALQGPACYPITNILDSVNRHPTL